MDLLRKALRDVEAAVKPRASRRGASAARSDPNDLTGTRVVVAGRAFLVGAMFAEGGAARVYRCASVSGDGRDGTADFPPPLALKQCLLPPELSEADAGREGVVHASVSAHNDVVTLHAHDVLANGANGEEDEAAARGARPPPGNKRSHRAALLVMDLCEESLAERVRRLGGLGERDALHACACVARAVAHMPARDPPVVHMDVKPENVLLSSETWRLCDFGSAVHGDRVFPTHRDRSRAESSFAKITTPTYRAPEMWDVHRPLFAARGVGRPVDVWALGCLLFQLLEDRPPFGAFEPKLAALQGRFTWSPGVVARTRERTRALVAAMLAVDPASRPSAEDAAARCAALAAGAGTSADASGAGAGAGAGALDALDALDALSSEVPKRVSEGDEGRAERAEPSEGWASFDDAETPPWRSPPPEPADARGGAERIAAGGATREAPASAARESEKTPTDTGWATFS